MTDTPEANELKTIQDITDNVENIPTEKAQNIKNYAQNADFDALAVIARQFKDNKLSQGEKLRIFSMVKKQLVENFDMPEYNLADFENLMKMLAQDNNVAQNMRNLINKL